MAHSPESHINVDTVEEQRASFESRAEVYLALFETELGDIVEDPSVQLGLRFADLRVAQKGPVSVVVPKLDRGAHPLLLTQACSVPSMIGYHDVRRAIVSYEDEDHTVTARDWLVDLTIGTCCVMESHRSRHELPSTESGPVVDVDTKRRKITLSEGKEYLNDFSSIIPLMMESDAYNVSDFLADTHMFIGGCVSRIDTKNPDAYQHIVTV